MAKEKSTDKEERRKEKKAAKEKRSETDGVHKSKKDKKDKSDKKEKKEKKEKKIKQPEPVTEVAEVTTELLNALEAEKPGSVAIKEDGDIQVQVKSVPPVGALVPFANPLADEKVGKKVLKSVRKGWDNYRSLNCSCANMLPGAQNKALKRGVKEVVKALRKSTATEPGDLPFAVVVIAADISPMDVISHIPVLCEDHSVPYIFVTSRTELGAAGSTKRPTSVTMITREKGGKKKDAEKDENDEEWKDVYTDLVKAVAKASKTVRI